MEKLGDDLYKLGSKSFTNEENFILYTKNLDHLLWDHMKDVPASRKNTAITPIDKGEKYMVTMRNRRTGETIRVDVYDVLEAFKITCSAMGHAIKKFLMAGKRGHKGFDKDCDEGINSVEQAKLLEKYRK